MINKIFNTANVDESIEISKCVIKKSFLSWKKQYYYQIDFMR